MKTLVCFLISINCFSLLAADDVSDAKIAFGNLIEYEKQDDLRALDLFSKNCVVVYKVIDEKAQTNSVVIPPDAFRMEIKKEIEQKHGNKDEYRDVQYSSDGFAVTLTANILSPDSGKEIPLLIKFGREDGGIMKIEELRMTIFKNFKSPEAH
jgi:hypothetical protein